jgi:hypothetical protein
MVVLACGCGGAPRSTTGGTGSTSAATVEVAGRVAQRGTRGSVLVFAYTDLAAGEAPAGREPASIGTLAPDGTFDVAVPASGSLTLVFLADGANDGVIDGGDPIALLSNPELADLQVGDRVQVSDAKIDFASQRVVAAVEVVRATGQPARTPTSVPGS